MKTILRAARCVVVVIALFTAADVVADDDRHGLNHYILDRLVNLPVIGSGPSVSASNDAVCEFCWTVVEIFSNADGSVQFLVLGSVTLNGAFGDLAHETLISGDGSTEHEFAFPAGPSSALHTNKAVLVATQGFADLGILKPDFVIPNGFLFTSNGSVRLRNQRWWTGDSIQYGALPADGFSAFYPDGPDNWETVDWASAFNSAGQYYYQFEPPATPNYEGIWWNAAEAGWGIGLTHQGDRIFATWFTYGTDGEPLWLSMPASRDSPAGNTYSGPLYINTGVPFATITGATTTTHVGTGSLAFSDQDTASFSYAVDGIGASIQQKKPITRYDLGSGPKPFCMYAAMPYLKYATNYQGLWWVPTEPGSGVNLVHQDRRIFATWYTSDADGKPVWLSALLSNTDEAWWIYAGPLMRTYGPRLDNYDPSAVAPAQPVGAVTVIFVREQAIFTYSTTGDGGLPAVARDTKVMERYLFAPPAGTVCRN